MLYSPAHEVFFIPDNEVEGLFGNTEMPGDVIHIHAFDAIAHEYLGRLLDDFLFPIFHKGLRR